MAIRQYHTNLLDIILNFIMESRKEHLGNKAILRNFFLNVPLLKMQEIDDKCGKLKIW